jgi:hypothetical protein
MVGYERHYKLHAYESFSVKNLLFSRRCHSAVLLIVVSILARSDVSEKYTNLCTCVFLPKQEQLIRHAPGERKSTETRSQESYSKTTI